MGSILSGIVALSLLELLVTTGSPRVTGLADVPAAVARWFIDPSVPGLPTGTASTPPAATPTRPPAGPAAPLPKHRAHHANKPPRRTTYV